MATKPKGSRDTVRFEANERVDLGDIQALQDNSRSESRLLAHNFLFGHGDMGLPDKATGSTFKAIRDFAGGATDAQANWAKSGSASPFKVSAPALGTTVTIEAQWLDSLFVGQPYGGALTGAFAGTQLPSGEAELGTACGTEGDASQIISLAGKPAGTYGVYVVSNFDPATPGTRIFWNATTASEDAQAISTRNVAGWTASVSLISGGAPSDAHVLIATVEWDGAQVTSSAYSQNLLFEGLLGSTTGTGTGGGFANGWGQDSSVGADPYGHRSNARLENGVSCWQDWAAAIRVQLRDIVGDDDGDGVWGWYTEVAKFAGTGGATGLAGEHASLERARDHIDAASDPHGTTLTQDTLIITNRLDLSAATPSDPTGLPFFSLAPSTGYSSRRTIPGTDFVDTTPDLHTGGVGGLPGHVQSATVRTRAGGVAYYNPANAVNSGRYSLNLNKLFASSALAANGALLDAVVLTFLAPQDIASVSTDGAPFVTTIPTGTLIATVQIERTYYPILPTGAAGARQATTLLPGTQVRPNPALTEWQTWSTPLSADSQSAWILDLSAIPTPATSLQMDTFNTLTLNVILWNHYIIDSGGAKSQYSFVLDSVAVTAKERLLHP